MMINPFTMLALSAGGVVLNLLLQVSCIVVIGAGSDTDAYFAAQIMPVVLAAILIGAITNNVTPQVSGLVDNERVGAVRTTLLHVGPFVLTVFVSFALTAQLWMPLLFSGLDQSVRSVAIDYARVFFGIGAMRVIATIGIAGHHARGRAIRAEAIQVVYGFLAVSLTIPVLSKWGIYGFVWLLAARSFLEMATIVTCYVCSRSPVMSGVTADLFRRMGHSLSASAIFKLGPLIDRSLASLAGPGMVTSMGLGQQIFGSVLSVADRALTRPLLVTAGRFSSAQERKEIASMYRRQTRIAVLASAASILVLLPMTYIAMTYPSLRSLLRLDSLGHIDIILLMVMSVMPAVLAQLPAAVLYGTVRVSILNRLAMLSFFVSLFVKVAGFVYFGVYAIIAGMIIYQLINWISMHIVATKFLR